MKCRNNVGLFFAVMLANNALVIDVKAVDAPIAVQP